MGLIMKFDPYGFSEDQYEHLLKACPPNTFRVVEPQDIPIQLPASLMSKVVGAVVVSSGDNANMVHMVNLIRRDDNVLALDQQPLAIAKHEGTIVAGFIQHGNWLDRTVHPPGEFLVAVQGSGIAYYYPYAKIPSKPSGDIGELEPDSQKEAFWNAVRFTTQ